MRGGTIRARVAVPPDVPEDQGIIQQWIKALPLFTLPEGVILGPYAPPHDGVFETEPLPPGRYRVRAVVAVGMSAQNPDIS